MNDEELAAIRKRVGAATPGPWGWWPHWLGGMCVGRRSESPLFTVAEPEQYEVVGWQESDRTTPTAMPDTNFIMNARQDIPDLLAEVDRLRAENATLNQDVRASAEALLRTHHILSAKEAENVAMREIVEDVADIRPLHNYWQWGKYVQCPFFCSDEVPVPKNGVWQTDVEHQSDCPVTKARALLRVENPNE